MSWTKILCSTAKLSCQIHTCPQRCHRLEDHSKMKCLKVKEKECPKKHSYRWVCHQTTPSMCPVCVEEEREELRKQKRDHELEQKRLAIQKEHAKNLLAIETSIKVKQNLLRDMQEERDRQIILAQRAEDLKTLDNAIGLAKEGLSKQPNPTVDVKTPITSVTEPNIPKDKKPDPDMRTENSPAQESRTRHSNDTGQNKTPAELPSESPTTSPSQTRSKIESSNVKNNVAPTVFSPAKEEWDRQKEIEGQSNRAIDELMNMIGLEEVKDKFLSIKTKVDTVVRQDSNLNDERFNAALLGNPGTGEHIL